MKEKALAIFCTIYLCLSVPAVHARESAFPADDSTAIKRNLRLYMQQTSRPSLLSSGGAQVAILSLPATYQWYVSVTGSDSNAGTESAPFRTIQYAINRAVSGQSIKVGKGRYTERIDFNGKSVQVVGSPNDPSATIIDAGGLGRVVTMTRKETASTLLCGFTLTGGSAMSTVYPDQHGAGIYLFDNAHPVLSDLIITGNSANSVSAIAAMHSSSPLVRNVLIYGNTTPEGGLDVRLHNGAHTRFHNVTLADGIGSTRASILLSSATLELKNSILYNPDYAYEIEVSASNLNASYNNIKNGSGGISRSSGTVNATTGLIGVAPGFVDPSSGHYQLLITSPCIDMGDPASSWNDQHLPPAHGTERNDLGAYGGQVSAQPYQEQFSATAVIFEYDQSGNMKSRRKIYISSLSPLGRLRSASHDGFTDMSWLETEGSTPVDVPLHEQQDDFLITIYPNPTKGALRVDITGKDIPPGSLIHLYNSSGSPVRQWNQLSGSNTMDISALPAGTYLMRIILGKNEASNWKIIKQ